MDYKLKCGCIVVELVPNFDIKYCPLHKAAPDMYEALRALEDFDSQGGNGKDHYVLLVRAKEALAKAEGK